MRIHTTRLGTSSACVKISKTLYLFHHQYHYYFCLHYISYAYPNVDAIAMNPDLHERAVYRMVLVLSFVLIGKRTLCIADLDHVLEW